MTDFEIPGPDLKSFQIEAGVYQVSINENGKLIWFCV
jgi:hypothetical protein